MNFSRTRVRALLRKELREYRRNGAIVWTMAIIPLVFIIEPTINIVVASSAAAHALREGAPLIYMLGIPAIVPAALAAYGIVGERDQGTLEPVLTTPIRDDELLLSKALAAFLPAVAIAYGVFGVFVICVELFANAAVAAAVLRAPGLIAQVIFTPLLASWSILVGLAVSTRTSDMRASQQLSTLASLPTVAVTTMISVNVIHPSLKVALGFGIGLLVVNRVG